MVQSLHISSTYLTHDEKDTTQQGEKSCHSLSSFAIHLCFLNVAILSILNIVLTRRRAVGKETQMTSIAHKRSYQAGIRIAVQEADQGCLIPEMLEKGRQRFAEVVPANSLG